MGRSANDDGYLRTESEDRIAGAGAGQGLWPLAKTPPTTDERTLEMGPVDGKGMGYTATAAGGGQGEATRGETGGGIVRTVQIRQYSSENT